MKVLVIAAVAAASLMANAGANAGANAAASVAGDAKQVSLGHQIAVEACSSCHRVERAQAQPQGVPNPEERNAVMAPSFAAIASDTRDNDAFLRQAITAPKHPMREQEWQKADLDAVVAYIRSLSGQSW
ncbi:MAG TPA: c-type cytochrome [Rhizomicrobium sp.]|nr:c-type cytochrome [Rhizomicrobium sp.]